LEGVTANKTIKAIADEKRLARRVITCSLIRNLDEIIQALGALCVKLAPILFNAETQRRQAAEPQPKSARQQQTEATTPKVLASASPGFIPWDHQRRFGLLRRRRWPTPSV
jgi:hypothetical protein